MLGDVVTDCNLSNEAKIFRFEFEVLVVGCCACLQSLQDGVTRSLERLHQGVQIENSIQNM